MSTGEPGTRRRWIAGLAVLGAAVVAALAVGVFGVHTLLVDEGISEEGPTFASGAERGAGEPADGRATTAPDPTSTPPTDSPETTAAPTVREAARGRFVDVDHPGEGSAVVLTDGVQIFVRFEDDFATDNGPDLYVTVAAGGKDVELGRLKGNVGAQNYELPPGVAPDAVESVSVWCKRFDSTFTTASLG